MTDYRLYCPTCSAPAHYVATFGAPGVGQHWQCDQGHDLVKLGGALFDVNEVDDDTEPPWIASPGDVI